VKRDLRAAR
jgi:hypothetical protein